MSCIAPDWKLVEFSGELIVSWLSASEPIFGPHPSAWMVLPFIVAPYVFCIFGVSKGESKVMFDVTLMSSLPSRPRLVVIITTPLAATEP